MDWLIISGCGLFLTGFGLLVFDWHLLLGWGSARDEGQYAKR